MSLFKREEVQVPRFMSRAEAFAFALQNQLSQGVEPLEAARKADEFASIFATNLSLPERETPRPEGIDKYLTAIDKVSVYIDKHPKLVELAVPVITFVAGLFTAKKDCAPAPPAPKKKNIDFDNVE